eukprot:GDKK01032017.1.p1 GENE.GDKK01032017.1~~GDKK01032017.1.p1  ORF type:complete len:267 (-),score=16.30 GDKK01032017.1:88-774(-)
MFAFDEVQSGYGRTGSMWACEQVGVTPDILLFAKGVANGLPLAGFITRKELSDKCPPGTQGGTYAGNAVACASAAEVIRVFRDEKILDNVVQRGQELFTLLEAMIKRNNFPIQEVRGRGLMIGFQFTDNAPAGIAATVVKEALANSLILLNTSKFETIRLIPALNVTKEQCEEAILVLEQSIKAALASEKFTNKQTAVGFRDCCEGKKCQCFSLDKWEVACRRITQFK